MSRKPILIEIDDQETSTLDVAAAPPVPDADRELDLRVAMGAASRPSRLSQWFWSLLGSVFVGVICIATWDFAVAMLGRWPIVGLVVSGAMIVLVVLALVMALGELTALSRMRRVDRLRQEIATVKDLNAARGLSDKLSRFYGGRSDLDWARARLAERAPELLDADALLGLTEDELMAPLDQKALQEVEKAARQVATVTAIVPLALADVLAVLVSSLRMIRSVAQIYGGRSGFLSSWKLTRSVMTHLAATGAVAIGDDMLESLLGGSVVSKLSRRFGEGLVNGALTARVGIAAMELCRPMPFSKASKPSVRGVIRRALTGLFGKNQSQ
ncbi:MAG: YcjF family protein [Paracoccaceae bacterium]